MLLGRHSIELLPVPLLIEQMNEDASPLIDQRKAAWGLAQDGSPEALAALKQALGEP